MGVTGDNGFPCCNKTSVNIEDTQYNINQPPPQEEDEMELEDELLALQPPSKMQVDLTPEPELKMAPKIQPPAKQDLVYARPPLREEEPAPQEVTAEFSGNASLEELKQQDTYQWDLTSDSSYLSAPESLGSTKHSSAHVQTSKHLFWAEKLIQTSLESLEKALNMQLDKKNREDSASHLDQVCVPKSIPSSQEQLQSLRKLPVLPPMEASLSYCPPPNLSPTISLAKLVNLATSLAVASSTKKNLPNLELRFHDPSQKVGEPSATPTPEGVPKPATEQAEQDKLAHVLLETPLEDSLPQKAWNQEAKLLYPYFDFNKPKVMRTTFEGKVKLLQTPATLAPPQEAQQDSVPGTKKGSPLLLKIHFKLSSPSTPKEMTRKKQSPHKPQRLLTREPVEKRAKRTQGRRLQDTALTQMWSAAAMATRAEQTVPRAKASKRLAAARSALSDPGAECQSFADENLLPLTTRQLSAFQDVFKLFSSGPTGTVDLCSMKAALRSVGVQLSPQKMCEALRFADLDGDGTVSFKDFLGVLTDNHHLTLCLGQVRNSQETDPRALQTLFIALLFKLMGRGFVPSKSVQEVMNYYSKRLRLNPGWRGWSRGQGRPASTHAGLTFCQATRRSGLRNAELGRPLHRPYKTGPRSPYSQIPTLAEKTPPEHRTRNRAPRPEVRLPKSYQPSRPKLGGQQPRLRQGESQASKPRTPARAESAGQSLERMHPSKLAPSPPTLVPVSPSPAIAHHPAAKNVSK